MAIFMEEEMQDLEIIIKLDPIHDGIKDFFNVGKIEERRGLLISTTGKYKTIDGDLICSLEHYAEAHSD